MTVVALRPMRAEHGGLARVVAVAQAHAEAVDREGRFPSESIAAMRAEGLLGAMVPARLGGGGESVRQLAAACYAVGRCCSSSAMILAMHQIQVASLVTHAGESAWLVQFLRRVAAEGLLLASVTSEAGVGGSMRTSLCAVTPGDDAAAFRLTKEASTVSYGAYADALLVTARAHGESVAGDQVLVVVPVAAGVMEQTRGWNAMGMRGTSSGAFVLRAEGSREQILPEPFSQIAAQTMVPVSHLLWASLWCGIASDAVTRARQFLRGKMRAAQGTPIEGGGRLVRAVERLQAAEARVRQALADHEATGAAETFAEAAAMNMLKTSTSEACLAVVDDAMLVCGFAGYSNEGKFSISRHLRDLHSARLMVHNDRVRENTSQLLLMQAPKLGVS